MSFKFKPEDFEYYTLNPDDSKVCADKANRILYAHLATLPKAYGIKQFNDGADYWSFTENQVNVDTHTALLWGITEIEKKECTEHVPIVKSRQAVGAEPSEIKFMLGCSIICAVCGLDIKPAKWEKA